MAERGNRGLRALDTRLGPLLLRALSVLHRPRPIPEAPRRIGVLCFGALGDLLLLSSVLEGMRAKLPEARFVLIGSGTNSALAPLLDVEEFVSLPVSRPDRALKRLRALELDLIVDSTQWARLPALLCALSGVASIGFRTAGQNRHYCYAQQIEHRNDRHEIDNLRALAAPLVGALSTLPRLRVTEAERAAVGALDLGRYVVFPPWPSGVNSHLKEWPTENWVRVAERLGQAGVSVVITGAPVDAAASERLANAIGARARVIDMAGKCSLARTAALLEQAACTVSVNTGVMHMAATFARPLVALSGPTNPLRWGPLSGLARNIAPAAEGCGYLNLGFEYPPDPPDCMGSISAAAVIAAVEEALS